LWADDALEVPAEVKSVVAVVDSSSFLAKSQANELLAKQLLFANLVVLNKIVG
jgi:G3E family GTPase